MRIIFISLLAIILSGCDISSTPFKLEEKKNNTYLINETTGTEYLVDDTNLIKLTEVNTKNNQLGRIIKTQANISEDRITTNVKVKLLGNQALYLVDVSAANKTETIDGETKTSKHNFDWFVELTNKYDSYKSITIQLKDSEHFKLYEKSVQLNSGPVRIMGYDGKPTGFLYEGKFQLEPELIQGISYIDIVWNF